MNRALQAIAAIALCVPAGAQPARFLRWADVQAVLSNLTEKPAVDEKEWDNWIRVRDANIREQDEHATEDAISALIIFGGSFTAQPAIPAAADAVAASGDLTPAGRARVDAFIQGLDSLDTDRFRTTLDYLRRRRVPQDELRALLVGNLRRYAIAQRNRSNTISLESSFAVNFAVDETLRAMKAKPGSPQKVRRIAVIGPGMEFAGEPGCSDAYPPQSVQPYAVLDSIVRQGWAQPDIQLVAFDINSFVLSQLRSTRSRSTLQLARRTSTSWTKELAAYWEHFGDAIAAHATAAAAPGFEIRAVTVKQQYASRLRIDDLDVIAQFQERYPDQCFDIVVATNLFESYDRLEHALALTAIAKITAPGGLLVTTGISSNLKTPEMDLVNDQRINYTDSGLGVNVTVYRRK